METAEMVSQEPLERDQPLPDIEDRTGDPPRWEPPPSFLVGGFTILDERNGCGCTATVTAEAIQLRIPALSPSP